MDATTVNPSGRHQPYESTGRRAALQIAGLRPARGWRVIDESGAVVLGWSRRWQPEPGRWDGLHDITVLDCAALSELTESEADLAALVVGQAAMSGVICCWPDVPSYVADRLGSETLELLRTPLPAPHADGLDWDVRGVRQRRAALREHATAFANALPTVSVLVVTRHPERLPHAVAQVRAQSYPELELIVAAPDTARLGLADGHVRVVEVGPDAPAGVLLAKATEAATGELLTRFDAADSYGPEHVWDLVLARHYADATLVGKPDEFVYLEKLASTIRRTGCRSEHYSHWVASGTMLVGRAELAAVGSWPNTPASGSVERALLDRVSDSGGRIYRTHGLGYLYHRHAFGHTWNPELGYFLGRTGAHWTGMLRHPEFSAG